MATHEQRVDFEAWRSGAISEMDRREFVSAGASKLGLDPHDPVIAAGLSLAYEEPTVALDDIGELAEGYGRQPDGSMKVRVWRGEHGEGGPLHSRRPSLSFGDKVAATHYARHANDGDTVVSPRLIAADIVLKKPVMVDFEDPFVDGSVLVNAIGVEATRAAFSRHEGVLHNQDNFFTVQEENDLEGCTFDQMYEAMGPALLNELYIDAYPIFDDPEVVDACRKAGFDGLIQGGNGETAMKAEYKVFSETSVDVLNVEVLGPALRRPVSPPTSPREEPDTPRVKI